MWSVRPTFHSYAFGELCLTCYGVHLASVRVSVYQYVIKVGGVSCHHTFPSDIFEVVLSPLNLGHSGSPIINLSFQKTTTPFLLIFLTKLRH